MTDTAIEAWPETQRVLAEAEKVTELKARLVGLVDAFKEVQGGSGEATQILSYLEDSDHGATGGLPSGVSSCLRAALQRMAANDPEAQELLGRL